MKRIGVFPAGSEIGLEICSALKYTKDFQLIGLSSVPSHASYVYNENIENLPNYYESNFIDELNEKIKKFNIDMIYPAYDDIQLFLTENQKKIVAPIVTASMDTVQKCRFKSRTYKVLEKYDFVPTTYDDIDNISQYPVFVKPDRGQGSQGARKVSNKNELEYILDRNSEMIICEYLPGKEYTISCFTDYKGDLLSCSMRDRLRIKNGISVSSKIIEDNIKIKNIALAINKEFSFFGAWFFQVKENDYGDYKLLEVAPRIAGTMGLDRNKGINYPLLTIYTRMGMPVDIVENKYKIKVDRALISRYQIDFDYQNIYVDLDDTIILKEKVNSYLMMFLYQAINKGKNIFLITKHIRDVESTLMHYKISINLFSEIIHLDRSDDKAKYINKKESIFIDDSFAERKNVSLKCNIPVFDISEIESLIDWRM